MTSGLERPPGTLKPEAAAEATRNDLLTEISRDQKEKEILKIVGELGKEGGPLGMMAGAALQRFEPGGKEKVPRLHTYFKNCLEEGVPLETIREVVRIARS